MAGRLVDYIGQGLAADLPVAATVDAALTPAAHGLYYATDTEALYNLNRSGTPAWVEMTGGGLTEGTSFPGSPSTGTRFRRTDLDFMVFFYDGTRWLSEQLFSLQADVRAATGTTTINLTVPFVGKFQLWLDSWDTTVNFDNSNGDWDAVLSWRTLSNVNTEVDRVDGTALTNSQWNTAHNDLSQVLPTTARIFYFVFQEVAGTAAFFGGAILHYRLIAT